MNHGEVLATAWRIFWRQKILWLVGILPYLVYTLATMGVIFLSPPFALWLPPASPEWAAQDWAPFIPIVVILASALIYLALMAFTVTAHSLGTLQADGGAERLTWAGLTTDSARHVLQVTGMYAILLGGVIVIQAVFMGCMVLASASTMGFASMCIFPLFFLLIPAFLVGYIFSEQAKAAIVVEGLGVIDGMRRGWEVLKENFWPLILMGLILYGGTYVLSLLAASPLYALMFLPFISGFVLGSSQPLENSFMSMMTGLMIAMPFYIVFQGILLTYVRSAWTITYLRITRPGRPSLPTQPSNA
jgi:hypothetical protein